MVKNRGIIVNNSIRIILILFILIAYTPNAFAKVKLTNDLTEDIGSVYGFYFGQIYLLDEISKKYPKMSRLAQISENEFAESFNTSIEGMDDLMRNHYKNKWNDIKKQLYNQVKNYIDIDQVSEMKARRFIELVRERARGNIESPIIETLLIFNSEYEKNPEREFIDGYKQKYSTSGAGEANGVDFSIDYPRSWVAKDGDIQNAAQKFVSENGRGLESLVVMIKEMPLQSGERTTEKDVLYVLSSKNIQNFIPK